jgi:hypothetical protein
MPTVGADASNTSDDVQYGYANNSHLTSRRLCVSDRWRGAHREERIPHPSSRCW